MKIITQDNFLPYSEPPKREPSISPRFFYHCIKNNWGWDHKQKMGNDFDKLKKIIQECFLNIMYDRNCFCAR